MYLLEKCTNEKEAERWSLSRQSRGKIGLAYTMNIGCSIAHISNILKGPKREKLHAMHVKELIKTNHFER